MRLAVVTSHPIQYHAPLFRALAEQIDLEVLYCHNATATEQAEAGFGVQFEWDVPLLEGYSHRFLRNVSQQPGIGTFRGLDTPELRDLISGRRYDAVLTNGWHYKSAWQAMWSCWQSHVPVLARSDSHLRTERHAMKRYLKTVPYRWFIPRLDACLAVGRWSADYFVHYGADPTRVFIVPHAVDPSFENGSQALLSLRSEFRQTWGLGAAKIVFLFVGKFIPKKRPFDFLRAIQRASLLNPEIAGLMVGDGPLRGECESYVRELKVPVRFAGFQNQSQIVRAYIAADALVVPSDGRVTWGVVVNEAMTCGRPCFVSDRVGCAPDLIIPGETGFVFPLGEADVLSAQMLKCASYPEQLHTLGANARRRIIGYSVPVAVDGVLEAISRVLGRPSLALVNG
jgi:glycosyltransferase involved in cell wall biosynthesis